MTYWLHVPMSVTSFCVQAWPTPRCCIRWSTATACLPLRAAPRPSMTSWWSAGIRTPWRGQPLRHSHGSLRTSSPSRILNTRRRLWPTDPQWWSPEPGAVLTPSCTLPSPSVTARPCMHGKTTASLLPCLCRYAGVCGVYVMEVACRGNVTRSGHVSLNSWRGLGHVGEVTGEWTHTLSRCIMEWVKKIFCPHEKYYTRVHLKWMLKWRYLKAAGVVL